jgi:hypothetical protein
VTVHAVGPALQLAIDRGLVVGDAGAENRPVVEQPLFVGVELRELDVHDPGVRTALHVHHECCAIGFMGRHDLAVDRRRRIAAIAVERAQQRRHVFNLHRARNFAEAILHRLAQVPFRQPEHAAELDAVHRMRRHQPVNQANTAPPGRLREHLHVVEQVQVDQMGDRLAYLAHRQRLAGGGFDESDDGGVDDRTALALGTDLVHHRSGRRGWGLGRGPRRREQTEDQGKTGRGRAGRQNARLIRTSSA